jgi:hypothetical protein
MRIDSEAQDSFGVLGDDGEPSPSSHRQNRQWRSVLTVVLIGLGLLGAYVVGRLGVEQMTRGSGMDCGSLLHSMEEPRDECATALNQRGVVFFVTFFVSEAMLIAGGLLLVTRRCRGPRPWLRAWVPTATIAGFIGFIGSFIFLLPGSAAAFQGSPGENDTTARVLLFLGTLAVPVVLSICVAGFGRTYDLRGPPE